MKRSLHCWFVQCLALLLLMTGRVPLVQAADKTSGYFAAIAYSERTRQWGYAEKCMDKDEAFKSARKACKAGDARVVVWSSNQTYCALALSPNGSFGCATGKTEKLARKAAHENCRKFGKNSQVVVCVRGGP